MKQEQFNLIVNNRLEKTKQLLVNKGKEYIRGGDKFHNFNRVSAMRGNKSLSALQGFLDKHIVSWLDIVDDVEKGNTQHISRELVQEKIGDIITYLVIAETLLEQEMVGSGKWIEKEANNG